MGTRANHKEKADQNQAFLNGIDQDLFPDWVVTVAFYKALHLVEMLFAVHGKHSDNHRDRHDSLKRNFKQIWRHYLPLYTLSRRARYKVRAISTGPGGTMRYAVGRLVEIEKLVDQALRPAG
jgi:hypothetical protein